MTKPRRQAVVLLLVGCIAIALVGGLIFLNLERTGRDAVALLLPGGRGPSASAIHADFPHERLDHEIGSDGQQFYAIARDPLHPGRVATDLDRPQYRLQRILYPALAWLTAAGRNGTPLVLALLAVNLLAIGVGTMALGDLARSLGRSCAYGLAFAVLPGAFLSVRMSAADALALALALAACAAIWRDRPGVAALAAVAAALAKESSYLIVAAVAIDAAQRRRVDVRLPLAAPIVVAGAWWAVLRFLVPGGPHQYVEFALPFVGLASAAPYWIDVEPGAGIVVLLAIAVGIVALVRSPRGPFALAIAVQLAFLVVLSKPTYQFFVSGPRTVLPLMAVALLALVDANRPTNAAGTYAATSGANTSVQ